MRRYPVTGMMRRAITSSMTWFTVSVSAGDGRIGKAGTHRSGGE